MKKFPAIAVLVLCLVPPLASAQERAPKRTDVSEAWTLSIGGGALLSPQYLGDDDYGVSLVPSIRVTYGDRFFASVEEGVEYNLVNTENFRAGPFVGLEFGRDEDGSSPFRVAGDRTTDLLGLGDIGITVSLGGFAEIDIGDFTLSGALGQAVSGHDGLTGELGVSYKSIISGNGPPIIVAIGPRLNFGDETYMSSFFGVNAAQSLASGLPAYEASDGIISFGGSATAIMPLTRLVSVTLIGNYNRLTSDAGNSPLVIERGSRDQAFIGLLTSYRFK